jgi:phosphatidylethanolamine-binding protein (PEBP) family uncharacterized protein
MSPSLCKGTVVMLSVVLSIAVAGCGGGGRVASSTERPRPKRPRITFAMAGAGAPGTHQTIPVRYTCDGTNTTPSFRWGSVPSNTVELALFLFKIGRSVQTTGPGPKIEATIEWAVAGLSPHLHAISAGKLPHGAVTASTRYSICPAKGAAGTYVFQLNALSHRLVAGPRFDANNLFREVEGSTVASGVFASHYKRV